jgi:hypothetical protein
MPEKKIPFHTRLSPLVDSILRKWAERWSVSMTEIMERSLREFDEREEAKRKIKP